MIFIIYDIYHIYMAMVNIKGIFYCVALDMVPNPIHCHLKI